MTAARVGAVERAPDVAEVKSIYDKAYGHPGIMGTHFDEEYSRVTKTRLLGFCSLPAGGRLLDLGTGDGDLWQYADPAWEWNGLDISEVGVRRAAGRFPALAALVGTTERLPYADGGFDAVVAADTLEHAFDLEASLAEVRRVLVPGGILALSVPAPDSLRKWGYNRLIRERPDPGFVLRLAGLVLKRILLFGRAAFQPIDRDLGLEAWQALLARSGFVVERCEAWPEPPLLPIVYLLAARSVAADVAGPAGGA